jgi:hypothetical protein
VSAILVDETQEVDTLFVIGPFNFQSQTNPIYRVQQNNISLFPFLTG